MRREVLVRAETGFEQMSGADRQNGLATFTEREDRAWAGDVQAVPALLQAEVERPGEPPPTTRDDDPVREPVAGYVEHLGAPLPDFPTVMA